MATDATRAAVQYAMSVASFEDDDRAWAILNALRDAMIAGPEHVESLADAVDTWDASHGTGEAPVVLPACVRPDTGVRS